MTPSTDYCKQHIGFIGTFSVSHDAHLGNVQVVAVQRVESSAENDEALQGVMFWLYQVLPSCHQHHLLSQFRSQGICSNTRCLQHISQYVRLVLVSSYQSATRQQYPPLRNCISRTIRFVGLILGIVSLILGIKFVSTPLFMMQLLIPQAVSARYNNPCVANDTCVANIPRVHCVTQRDRFTPRDFISDCRPMFIMQIHTEV